MPVFQPRCIDLSCLPIYTSNYDSYTNAAIIVDNLTGERLEFTDRNIQEYAHSMVRLGMYVDPVSGSTAYLNIIEQLRRSANPTTEDTAMKKEDADYNWVVTCDGTTWTISPPKAIGSSVVYEHYDVSLHSIAWIYERARYRALSVNQDSNALPKIDKYTKFIMNALPKAVGVYPQEDSIEYEKLVSISRSVSAFKSTLSCINAITGDGSYEDTCRVCNTASHIIKKLPKGLYIDLSYAYSFIAKNKRVKLVTVIYSPDYSTLVTEDRVLRMYTGDKGSPYVNVCQAYIKKYAETCKCCGEHYNKDRVFTFKDQSRSLAAGKYCTACLEEKGYIRCHNRCGSVFHHVDEGCQVYTNSPYGYIYSYGKDVLHMIYKMFNTPADKKVNGEYLRYGVELEVLPRAEYSRDYAASLCDEALRGHAILKSDASLGSYGFEIVTSPATLSYHRSTLWDKFFNLKLDCGKTAASHVRSWDTHVCGIHVHMTRAALTDLQLSKMLVFYHDPINSSFLSRIAGRTVGIGAMYCQASKKKLGIHVKNQCSDHHSAITISNRNKGKTAEVRIFRGNATYHGVMRCIEFVDAVAAWCGQNSSNENKNELSYEKFLLWFNTPSVKSQYPELKKHLINLRYLTPRIKNDSFKHLEVVDEQLRTA